MRKRHWPAGLYERDDGYFSWRNPLTGEELGIGRVPLAEASAQAIEANLHVRGLMQKPRLIDRLTGDAQRSVTKLVESFEAMVQKRVDAGDLSPVTLKQHKSYGRALDRAWGARAAASITTLDAASLLDTWKDLDQHRSAAAAKSYGTDLFRHAEAKGWIERGSNPFTVTEKITVRVRRARLTFAHFQEIYGAAGALEPWVQRSMELALVSAQRREDLAAAEFKPRQDAAGRYLTPAFLAERMFWVRQQKVENSSGMQLRIPYELALRVVGWSLEAVVARCRDDVVSRHLLHHSKRRGTQCEPGDQIWIDTITKGFRRARDRTSLRWEGQDPPTFNEIRSLAARLYEAQGNVSVQALLGHTDPATTRIYTDARGAAWHDIKVA